jgi:TetR/AcrR family transcriptional regulator, lmrAB and yxaGH operons repressor
VAHDVRGKMAVGAAHLLAQRGLQGTSFAEVLERSGAPRGSVYHHFPGGKRELVEAALDAVSRQTAQALEAVRGGSPTVVAERFLALWRALLDRSEFKAGCAVLAVTVAADSPELLDHAGGVFRSWTGHLAGLLVDGGVEGTVAAQFATLLIASSEGAVVLSRAARSREPFDSVAGWLMRQAAQLT